MKRITPTIIGKFLSYLLKLFNKVFLEIPVPVQRHETDASFNHVLFDKPVQTVLWSMSDDLLFKQRLSTEVVYLLKYPKSFFTHFALPRPPKFILALLPKTHSIFKEIKISYIFRFKYLKNFGKNKNSIHSKKNCFNTFRHG